MKIVRLTLSQICGFSGFRIFTAMTGFAATMAFAQPALMIEHNGGSMVLSFLGVARTTNAIQWNSACQSNSWVTLTNVALSSNQFVTVRDSSIAGQRFYRLAITGLPPKNPLPDELVWIPAGTFLMGSPAAEQDRYSREGPQTAVTISRGFWMGMHEVTQFEYATVTGSFPSFYRGAYLPVETVSWFDATNYCAQRTIMEREAGTIAEGYAFRLPTEAEWEYAARAGTTSRFSFGNDPTYSQLSDYAWYGEGFGSPNHLIQQKQPNPWGLYDMHGNVYEWCWDRHASSLPGGSVSDPTGPVIGAERILRSGSTESNARDTRCAFRDHFDPAVAFANAGFRVVLARVP